MKKFFALHRNVRTRIGLSFVNKLIDAMILTFIAVYLASKVGATAAGALLLVFAVFAVFGMLVGGHLSEIWGRRPMLIVGDLAGCVFLVLMSIAYYANWGPLAVYFSYAMVKFGSNMALPANDATIVDVTPPADRKYVYTVNYWVVNLALGGGALVGSFLYTTHFGAVMVASAIGMAGALTVTVLFIAETKPAVPSAEPPVRKGSLGQFVDGYRLVLTDSTFRRLIIAATLGLTLEGQMNNYVGIRLAGTFPLQHLFPFGNVDGVRMLGMLKAENTFLVVVAALFINALLSRLSDRFRLYGGIALFAGGFAVLAVSGNAWVLLLACFVLTIGELMNVPIKLSLLAELAPEQGRPRYMAAYYLHIRFGQVLTALYIILGSAIGSVGMAGVYLLMGVLIILQYRAILATRAARAELATPVSV
jgi:DHA1 family multidrug resistance protein B-like MFS transporter